MQRSILIADDSSTIREVVRRTFENRGIEVVCAADGREALATAEQARPDLALVDVLMPEVDGYEVSRRLAGGSPGDRIPVLLLTGAFEPFDEEMAAECGAVGHLVKPFEPQALVDRVEALLGGLPPRDRAVDPLESEAGRRDRGTAEGEEKEPLETAPDGDVFAAREPWSVTRAPLPGEEGFSRDFAAGGQGLSPAPTSAAEPVLRAEARRAVEELAPEIIREVAWEILPDLLERLIREMAPAAPAQHEDKDK
ncbi:MAG: response regulator [Acidobacteriota bacterium]|nr:response regulator [Acidobacteriota bacterium]MDQ7086734.1 response regulator [Acidobacteriota bacterium]